MLILPHLKGLPAGNAGSNTFKSSALDLNFAVRKSLVDSVSGNNLVTFTRASSATFTGSDGLIKTATTNEARFDHNPTTGESLGLLVEEARTNLLLRSEEFNDASWNKTNASITVNAISAPNNTVTADKLVEDTATSTHTCTQGFTGLLDNTIYTFSAYLKQAERTIAVFVIRTKAGSFPAVYFNLTSGIFSNASAGITASIVNTGNGWYKCSATLDIGSGGSTPTLFILPTTAAGVQTYTGDGTSGIYLWGAQLEAGAFPTSYIPTTTATVTRAADVASITGSNFSSWYNQTEGTVFTESRQIGDVLGFIAAISDGTDNNRIAQFRNGTTLSSRCVRAGTATNPGNVTITLSQSLVKSVIAAVANSCGAAVNGTLATDATPTALPTVDRIGIGLGAPGSTPLNGTIKRLVYWGQRLPNNVLQAITQ